MERQRTSAPKASRRPEWWPSSPRWSPSLQCSSSQCSSLRCSSERLSSLRCASERPSSLQHSREQCSWLRLSAQGPSSRYHSWRCCGWSASVLRCSRDRCPVPGQLPRTTRTRRSSEWRRSRCSARVVLPPHVPCRLPDRGHQRFPAVGGRSRRPSPRRRTCPRAGGRRSVPRSHRTGACAYEAPAQAQASNQHPESGRRVLDRVLASASWPLSFQEMSSPSGCRPGARASSQRGPVRGDQGAGRLLSSCAAAR